MPSFYRFLNKQINIAMVLRIWEKPKGSIFIYIFEKKTTFIIYNEDNVQWDNWIWYILRNTMKYFFRRHE